MYAIMNKPEKYKHDHVTSYMYLPRCTRCNQYFKFQQPGQNLLKIEYM